MDRKFINEENHNTQSAHLLGGLTKSKVALITFTTLTLIIAAVLVTRSVVLDQETKPKEISCNALFTTSSTQAATYRTLFSTHVSNASIRDFMSEFSNTPHIAGSPANTELAEKVFEYFQSWGFDRVYKEVFPVLLTNLTNRSVVVTSSGYVCNLTEDNIFNQSDWYSALPVSNGYSYLTPEGATASGLVLWVNYGRLEDFQQLSKLGVSFSKSICVARYGMIFRGNKAQLAEQYGCKGLLIVNDPADVVKGPILKNGPWATPRAAQRGTVYNGEGDPSTPGFPSEALGPRLNMSQMFDPDEMFGNPLPKIPVVPMGYGDAAEVLKGLLGVPLPESFNGTGFSLNFVGPGPTTVTMSVAGSYEYRNLTNVHGIIYGGFEKDREVLMGCHRDAWTYGSLDPISGHSIMLETARNFGLLHKENGWVPRRTIHMMSWDAEEWGLLGSVEFVERTVEQLRQRAVAYINLDVGVSGTELLIAEGSPLLQNILQEELQNVYVNSTTAMSKIYAGSVFPAGSGSDHTAFIQYAGVPVLYPYITNTNGAYESVYHSNYDNLFWADHFADPGFRFHEGLCKVVGRVIMNLADANFIPFVLSNYADSIRRWVQELQRVNTVQADFSFLTSAVQNFTAAARAVDMMILQAVNASETTTPLSPYEARSLNDRLHGVERVFLGDASSTGAGWFRHVIFTPSAINSYGSTVFPLIQLGLQSGNKTEAEFAIKRIAQFINRAAAYLTD